MQHGNDQCIVWLNGVEDGVRENVDEAPPNIIREFAAACRFLRNLAQGRFDA